MGRTVDQDVHAAFVEFRAKGESCPPTLHAAIATCPHVTHADRLTEDDKCLSVQCIYCQQIRAKNTSRQKQHLLECPGLANHPNAPRPQASPGDGGSAAPNGIYGTPTMNPSAGPMPNGLGTPMQATPMQNMASRPQLPSQSSNAGPSTATPVQRPIVTPKPQKTPKSTPSSTLPAPPLDDVHAAFVEFRAKEEDKVCHENRQDSPRSNALTEIVVSFGAMHLLQPDSSKKYKPTASASSRVPYLSQRHQRFYPCEQSSAQVR
jgi:hypothetical protein